MMLRDPNAMSAPERRAELASILALGYRRFRVRADKGLDETGQVEALCDQPVDGDGADTGEEHVA